MVGEIRDQATVEPDCLPRQPHRRRPGRRGKPVRLGLHRAKPSRVPCGQWPSRVRATIQPLTEAAPACLSAAAAALSVAPVVMTSSTMAM